MLKGMLPSHGTDNAATKNQNSAKIVFLSLVTVEAANEDCTSRAGNLSLMEESLANLPPALSSRAHITLSPLKLASCRGVAPHLLITQSWSGLRPCMCNKNICIIIIAIEMRASKAFRTQPAACRKNAHFAMLFTVLKTSRGFQCLQLMPRSLYGLRIVS